MIRNLLPCDKSVLFPMLLSDEYRKFQSVSDMYIALEQALLERCGRVSVASVAERDVLKRRGLPAKQGFNRIARSRPDSVLPSN